jgi:hypothetical protein
MLTIAIYPSHHGFGHASRVAALAEQFIAYGAFVHIRSAKPDFLFQRLDPERYRKEDVVCDVGVRHGRNLATDLEATKGALLGLFGKRREIVEREVEFLRRERVDFIVSDIPFLVAEAAGYARIPVFAVSNFDWLFIYDRLFKGDSSLKPVLNTIFGLYQRMDHAFVMPFSSPQSMLPYPSRERGGLLTGSKKSYSDVREALALPSDARILTCMFGGEGVMELDLEKVCQAFPGYVLSTNRQVRTSNHRLLAPEDDWLDIIHSSDVLLTKPGYSTFAEAVQFGKFIVFCARENYPEEEALIKGLGRYPYKRQIDRLDQSVSGWRKILAVDHASNRVPASFRNSSRKVAASVVNRYLLTRYPGRKLYSIYDAGSNNINYALCVERKREPVHVAHLETGLGRNYRLSKDGELSLDQKDLIRFKAALNEFLPFDNGLDSSKQVLGTGIARKAANIGKVSDWLQRRWNLPYKVISPAKESRYAYLAARSLIPDGSSALIVDIGGFSTEVILIQAGWQISYDSLELGLLTLRREALSGRDHQETISRELLKLSGFQPETIIAAGLSATYLARAVNPGIVHSPSNLHGTMISFSALKQTAPGQELDVARLSRDFFISLLDKYLIRELKICYYGISLGYFLEKSTGKQSRKRGAG